MTIRTISPNESLESLWEELVYSEARLLKDERARDLAQAMSALLERWETVRRNQLASWRAEIIAQAGVDDADDDLDDAVVRVDRALLRNLDQDRTSPRYTRYFNRAPSLVVRLGLQSELGVVRGWPASLGSEPEDEVKQTAAPLSAAVEAGDKALEGRRTAASARADQRVREVLSFIDDVNRTRLSIYGELTRRAAEGKLPKGWSSRFFPRGHRSQPREDAPE